MKKFNVGDIVKIRKEVYCPFTVGGKWDKGARVGVVIHKDMAESSCPYVVFSMQGDTDGIHTWVYEAEDLKLITPIHESIVKAYGEQDGA